MSNDGEKLSEQERSRLLNLALGPVEDWDESDADFVLRVNGVDPAESPNRLARLINREIENLRQQGEEIPKDLIALHASLLKEAKKNKPLAEARRRIQNLFLALAPIEFNRVVHVYGRRIKKLSEKDKRILDELANELVKEHEASLAKNK